MRLSEINKMAWEMTALVPYEKERKSLKPLSMKKLREMRACIERDDHWVKGIRYIMMNYNDPERKKQMQKFANEFIKMCANIDRYHVKTIFRYLLWNISTLSEFYKAERNEREFEKDIEKCLRAEGVGSEASQKIVSSLRKAIYSKISGSDFRSNRKKVHRSGRRYG